MLSCEIQLVHFAGKLVCLLHAQQTYSDGSYQERLQEESSAQLFEAQNQFDQYVQKHEKLMVDTKYVNAQEKEKLDRIMRELEEEKRTLANEAQKFNEKQAVFEVRMFLFSITYSYSRYLRARNLHGRLKG